MIVFLTQLTKLIIQYLREYQKYMFIIGHKSKNYTCLKIYYETCIYRMELNITVQLQNTVNPRYSHNLL